MHVETVEIGMSTLGTGALTEFALLGHWGDAFGHGLTKGKETVLSDLVDQQGNSLYTGYYYTLLKVPPKHLLSSFKIWSHLELGVNTTAFGAAMLNSAFRAGVPGSVESDDPTGRVEMDAGHYVLIEGIEGGQKPSVPKPGLIVELEKATTPPQGMKRFKEARLTGVLGEPLSQLRCAPMTYSPVVGRDYSPGHGFTFASFVATMDLFERRMLKRGIEPGVPEGLLDHLEVLERETCYMGNTVGEEEITGIVSGRLSRCGDELKKDMPRGMLAAALLETEIQLYKKHTNSLLAVTRAKKVFAVPRKNQAVMGEVERILRSHGAPA